MPFRLTKNRVVFASIVTSNCNTDKLKAEQMFYMNTFHVKIFSFEYFPNYSAYGIKEGKVAYASQLGDRP